MRDWKNLTLVFAIASLAACGASTTSGSDAGTAGGEDAATATGADASASLPDTGLPPPLDFTVSISASCPFSACGGLLPGVWDYTSLCITEAEVVDPIKAQCSGATFVSATGTGKGRVTFTATRVTRDIDWSGTASLDVPATCALGSCANAQALLRQIAGFETATCTGTTTCACTVPLKGKTLSDDPYVLAGNTVKVTGGHDYQFCVAGSTLTYDDVTTPSGELGVATMSKR